MKLDRQKFKSLVHYVCYKCHEPSKLGKTKLNKVLYYSDFSSYYYSGKSITNETYIKHQFGPVPADIDEAITSLVKEGALVVRDVEHFGYTKKEFISLTKPNIKEFSGEEISLVDQVVEIICDGHTARSISEASHDDIWKLADIGEEIPYHTVFSAELGEITEEDINWAKKQLKKAA